MSNDSNDLEARISKLSERERKAYEYFCQSDQRPVAPTYNAQLFTLYLNGKSVTEIHRLNPALSLGQVVHARVEGDWDRRRDEYVDELLNRASDRQVQSTMESVEFLQDMLAVLKKRDGDKYRRYLQSGDINELKDTLQITSLDGMKKVVEAMQKLTGADRDQTVRVIQKPAAPETQEPQAKPTPHAALKLVTGGK